MHRPEGPNSDCHDRDKYNRVTFGFVVPKGFITETKR